jgi:hypothetical protein
VKVPSTSGPIELSVAVIKYWAALAFVKSIMCVRERKKYCVSLVKLCRFRIMKDMNAQLIRNENVIRDDLEITYPKRTDLQS